MTRRLRIASTAFGALLLPACVGMGPEPGILQPNIPPTQIGHRPPATPKPAAGPTVVSKPRRSVEGFAEGRSEPTPTVAPRPLPVNVPVSEPDKSTPTIVAPVEHETANAMPPQPSESPRLELPRPTIDRGKPAPEPIPDAEGIIRPQWPVLKGTLPLVEPTESTPAAPAMEPVLPPPSELLTPAERTPETKAPEPPPARPAPPPLPPGVIGTTLHQTNASPVDVAPAKDAGPIPMTPWVEQSTPQTGESPLLLAVRAFQMSKPDEAVMHLRAFDPASQQILLSLLPALVRLSDGKLEQMSPEEMDLLLAQLTKAPNVLRSRASLQANNVRLCREVHNFAHVEPFPTRHQFRPGDIVYLYMELANFSCTPDPKVGYTIMLASCLELRDAAGHVVWRADPKEIPDTVSTPPQDYYRNYRLCIPNVPPGTYTLHVKTTDRPTGRELSKAIEVSIGGK
jgi:hypothetical protein